MTKFSAPPHAPLHPSTGDKPAVQSATVQSATVQSATGQSAANRTAIDQAATNALTTHPSSSGARWLDGTPTEHRRMTIVGIAGASGAGKSLLARLLYEQLSVGRSASDIGILNEDSYYRDRSDLTLAQREKINYDHPDALEHDLLIEHLTELRLGRSVQVPQYNYALHNRSPETVTFVPPKLLILEGILILHVAALAERLDLRVFVDVPLDVCLTRRLRRDIQQRGRQLESVLRQYETSVRPMFFKFIDPSKTQADIIVPRGGENKAALSVLLTHLEGVLLHAD